MKNLLFSVIAFVVSASSTAQLYVKPTSTGDASYMYVKDELLYVKGTIELTENPEGPTKASIYFRDESQLMQGDNVNNDGTGYISILQTNPDSDAWDYAYWSSPVGDQTIGGAGNKKFGATRFFNPANLLGTISEANNPTGALNGVKSPMRISRRWLYTYTFAGGWSRINDNSDVLPGRGFTMKGLGTTNSNLTYDFRGRPNNGNITAPVTAGEINLSGNPYPSALDLKTFYAENTDISAIYFWDEDHSINSHYYVDNQGGYGTWIPGGLGAVDGVYAPPTFLSYDNSGNAIIGSDNGDGLEYPRRYAPVGQGFMLFGLNSGTVTYKNTHRINQKIEAGVSIFRRPDRNKNPSGKGPSIGITPSPVDTRQPQLRMNTYFNNSHGRQLVLLFSDESTDGYDRGQDGRSPMDSPTDGYFPIEAENQEVLPYVIQTVPYHQKKQIPYTLVLENRAKIMINFKEKINFDGPVYFYDNLKQTYQEIKDELDQSVRLKLEAGTYENRFFITFTNERSAQETVQESTKIKMLEDLEFFQNNPVKQLEVGNPEGYNIATATIFEMSGKLVYTASNLGNSSKFTFPTGNLSDGIYLVMLITKDNIAVNYKITVYNK